MMQRQGQMEADGSPAAGRSRRRAAPEAPEQRTSLPGRLAEFLREVRSELRQVAWPTRSEIVNSSIVVLVMLILLVGLIFLLNYAFNHFVACSSTCPP